MAYLIAEGGVPQKIKAAYLTDEHIIALADHAAWTRRTPTPATPPVITPATVHVA